MNIVGWPFADAENTAVFTTRFVVEHGAPITYVTHDTDDGAWQFRDSNNLCKEVDARIVGLSTICTLDPSIKEIADLPLGWHAWREGKHSIWIRGEMSE